MALCQWAQVLMKVARAINPSVEIGAMSAPSVLVPVVAMAQVREREAFSGCLASGFNGGTVAWLQSAPPQAVPLLLLLLHRPQCSCEYKQAAATAPRGSRLHAAFWEQPRLTMGGAAVRQGFAVSKPAREPDMCRPVRGSPRNLDIHAT